MSAVRRQLVDLEASLHRVRQIVQQQGLYAPQGRSRGYRDAWALRVKALQHELDTLADIAGKLDKASAPRRVRQLSLPREGTVARTVLQVLHLDAMGHDHDGLRELTGLTDAELATRITGAGINSVRPRRVDLVRAGWVEVAGQTGTARRWRLTAEGRAAMDATLDAALEEVAAGG